MSELPPIDWTVQLQQHGRWLRAVLVARSRDSAALEELFQEVALAVVRESHRPMDAAHAAPWLYRIAVRQALLHRRRLGRRRRLLERFGQSERREQRQSEEHTHHDPLHWLLADERNQLIRQSLAALPPRDAELLLLKYTEDWSCRDIAEHLGLSERAADSRLHRARQKLRTELARRQVIEVPS